MWEEFSNDQIDHSSSPIFTVKMDPSGAGTQDPETMRYTKWREPPSCSTDGAGTSKNAPCRPWVVTVTIVHVHSTYLGPVSAWVQISHDNEPTKVPIKSSGSFATQDQNYVEDRFDIQLDSMINDSTSDGTNFTLKIIVNNFNYDVAQFEIKDFKMSIQVENESYTPGQVNVRDKKQKTTKRCKSKDRLQRLDKESLEFSLCTNVQINHESVLGFVKREAMISIPKAITGDTEVPLVYTKSTRQTDDNRSINYCNYFTAHLDPAEFYDNNEEKELYTSDRCSADNNIFLYYVCVPVDNFTVKQDVYRFKTKSKERTDGKVSNLGKFLKIESETGRINNLTIETMKTVRGDIAYSWKLLNPNTDGSYEEGDVVGLFPAKPKGARSDDKTFVDHLTPKNCKAKAMMLNDEDEDDVGDDDDDEDLHADDKSFIDHLTPKNCKNAIAAGVITRSYYLDANSQQDGEKLCMVGMVKVKVSGSVQHGDFIYASNELPGVAVTQDQLTAGKDKWREKRLLGTSLETNQETGVKLVNCIVSLLLCINNDEVESVLSQLDDKIDRFRDEVSTSKKASRRRNGCVCLIIIVLLLLAIMACYIFLWPTSFYNEWKCHRGALPGILTFHLVNRHSDEYINMKGALFKWSKLKYKLDLHFHHKKNFNGSYYLNLRRCQSENLRRVLGWFSNPPVYMRAQVFLSNCNCTRVFHYQKYGTWKEYKHKSVFNISCNEEKGPYCRKKVEEEKFHHY